MALHKVLAECFHGGSLRKPGETIDYSGPEVAYLQKVEAPKSAAGAKSNPPGKPNVNPSGKGTSAPADKDGDLA